MCRESWILLLFLLLGFSFLLFNMNVILIISTVALPHELQPWIYRYGVALPFWNLNRTVRTIIFDTKNEIAQNLGIILAWIVVSLITVSLATWLTRRGAVNQHRRAKREGVEAEK